MRNPSSIQNQEITSSRSFSKFRVILLFFLILLGSLLSILYFIEFYTIHFKGSPVGIMGRTGKDNWIYQSPMRYLSYCLAAGIVVLFPVCLAIKALTKKSERYYQAATMLFILFSIVRSFLE